jgi:hypothetical protein
MKTSLRCRPRRAFVPKWARAILCLWVSLPMIGSVGMAPLATPLSAQAGSQRDLLSFLNHPATLRLEGNSRIPAGTLIEAPVAILGGSLDLAGRIAGDLVIMNGDLRVHPGGRVDGTVRVVGGVVRETSRDWLGGTLQQEAAPQRYRIRGGVVEFDDPTTAPASTLLSADLGFATVHPWLRSAGPYNRVEGLPMELGGFLETRSRNPLRVDALAIWRSISGLELDQDNVGSIFRLRQGIGGNREAEIELTRFSRIVAFEDRGLSSLESSLSTFFLRRDLQDQFEEVGWSVAFLADPVDSPLRLRLEYREDENNTARIQNPWTLRNNEAAWRPLPIVAEGTSRSLLISAELDTRNDLRDPATGWWINGSIQRRVGGTQRIPVLPYVQEGESGLRLQSQTPSLESLGLATVGRIDLRRYNRLGPSSRLNLRFLASGPLNSVPLPPQDQTTLGGEGSLPGHPRFSVDCGARRGEVLLPGDPETSDVAYPAYGCDGVWLGQIQLQGQLPFSWSPFEGSSNWEAGSMLKVEPTWTVFLGAGRGWRVEEATPGDLREDSPLRVDAGVGLFVGPLGVYWAAPLNRRDRGLNFFVRLSNRF